MRTIRRLTDSDRERIRAMHAANPTMSHDAMARLLGLGAETIRMQRKALGWVSKRAAVFPDAAQREVHLRRTALLLESTADLRASVLAAMLRKSHNYASSLIAEVRGRKVSAAPVVPVVVAPKPPHLSLPSGRFSDWA